MDDEEEDMSLQRPVSQCWGTPFREIKFHDRESRDREDTQDRSTQTSTGPNAVVPRSEGHDIMVPQGHSNNNFPCGVEDNHQSRILFHGKKQDEEEPISKCYWTMCFDSPFAILWTIPLVPS